MLIAEVQSTNPDNIAVGAIFVSGHALVVVTDCHVHKTAKQTYIHCISSPHKYHRRPREPHDVGGIALMYCNSVQITR